jgi:hypothetical protein
VRSFGFPIKRAAARKNLRAAQLAEERVRTSRVMPRNRRFESEV